MQQVPLCLDWLFEHFKHLQINQVLDVNQKFTLHRPNSITKVIDGLFKYNGNRAWFACALSYWGHLKIIHFIACAYEKNGMLSENPAFFIQISLL